jgi:hypothetical protein
MKIALVSLLSTTAVASPIFAADWQRFSKSSRKALHIERELLDFFDRLRESDGEGKHLFHEALRPVTVPSKMQLDAVRIPKVVLWYPSREKTGPSSLQSADSTYLLMLAVGGTRENDDDVSACLIGEFHVLYESKRRADGVLETNSLTIGFRGFRLVQGNAKRP